MVDRLCTLSNVAPRLQFDLQVGIADSKFERPIRIMDNNSVTTTQTGRAGLHNQSTDELFGKEFEFRVLFR